MNKILLVGILLVAIIYFVYFRKKEDEVDNYEGAEKTYPKYRVVINKDLAIR